LDLVSDGLKKYLPLVGGQEVERARKRPQQDVRIPVVQIGSGQKVSADHLQAVAAGLITSEHQSCRLECLLDYWNLALVQLEVDDFPRLGFSPGQLLLNHAPELCLGI
jgi:hypothetical protein